MPNQLSLIRRGVVKGAYVAVELTGTCKMPGCSGAAKVSPNACSREAENILLPTCIV